jgi:hypothetical protein
VKEEERVLENRVLRRILGPKRGEMKGGWRKLHNEELITCTRRLTWTVHKLSWWIILRWMLEKQDLV